MNPRVLIPPVTSPVSAEQSWQHLRVDVGDPPVAPADAADIALKLRAAVLIAEKYTGLALAPKTMLLVLDAFPASDINLRVAPVSSIDSIVYTDADGVDQTMDAAEFQFDPYSDPPRLAPAADSAWPTTKSGVINAVRVTFQAGYSAASASPQDLPMPEDLMSGILLILGHLYENREDTTPVTVEEIPYGAKCLMYPHRVDRGFA